MGSRSNDYYCQLKHMIADWRSAWATSSGASPTFPFVVVQLAAYTGSAMPLAALRWAQSGVAATPGAAQNGTLPNVGLTVGVDLSDPSSPCGNVHIRDKQAVGARTARAALAFLHADRRARCGLRGTGGASNAKVTAPAAALAWTGPVAQSVAPLSLSAASGAAGAAVTFVTNGGGSIGFVTLANQTTQPYYQGFDLLVAAGDASAASWLPANATVTSTGDSGGVVTVRVAPASVPSAHAQPATALTVHGVRYAWTNIPDGKQLYDSQGLPARPWLATCAAGAAECDFVPAGHAPIR